MSQKSNDSHGSGANCNASHKIPVIDPIVQPAAALVDENHDADEKQNSDDLQGALHAANFERMTR